MLVLVPAVVVLALLVLRGLLSGLANVLVLVPWRWTRAGLIADEEGGGTKGLTCRFCADLPVLRYRYHHRQVREFYDTTFGPRKRGSTSSSRDDSVALGVRGTGGVARQRGGVGAGTGSEEGELGAVAARHVCGRERRRWQQGRYL